MFTTQITNQLPLLLFISFDGFRHDYISPTYAPNLFDISKNATLGHMESLYITKTFPNHFSMVTGLYEDEHQITNNKMFDPNLNDTFQPSVTSPTWWNPSGTTIPIWVANQLFGEKRHSASMMYPGTSTSYQNILPTHLQDFNTVRNWTLNIDTVIRWLEDPEQPANLVTMYFDDPDSTAHNHGPWGQKTLEAVKRIDTAAGYLIKRLEDSDLLYRTNIIFVSDHGMAEVRNVVYLSDTMETDKFDMYGATPDWSVFVKPQFRNQKNKIFRELLAASKKNHYRIYKRSDIPPELHYSKSPRIGDFFMLVEEQFDLYKERPKNARDYPEVWGNHGWKPSDRDMRPLFMAYGPSFRQNYYHAEPFPNIDLFPLMVLLLDLPSEELPNNGSLGRIIDIIDLGHFKNSKVTSGVVDAIVRVASAVSIAVAISIAIVGAIAIVVTIRKVSVPYYNNSI